MSGNDLPRAPRQLKPVKTARQKQRNPAGSGMVGCTGAESTTGSSQIGSASMAHSYDDVEPIAVAPRIRLSGRKLNTLSLATLILCTLFVGELGIRLTPFQTPMPVYWQDAQEYARTLRISDTFTPDFYPALLGIALRLFGRAGPAQVQLLMYEIFAVMVYCIFRTLDMSAQIAALFSFLLALCPDLITGTQKIWDIEASCAAYAAFACCMFLIVRRGATFGRTIMTGVVWGAGIAIRPNFPALALSLVYALWLSLPKNGGVYRRLSLHFLLAAGTAFGTMAMLNTIAHGSFYWAQNGPYNFFAGANEFTGEFLKSNLNAEPSIVAALRKMGINNTALSRPDARLQKVFLEQGIGFVRSHPFEWACHLSALKFMTMLRPDTKIHGLFSPEGFSRIVVSGALLAWVLTLCLRVRSGLSSIDSMTVVLIGSYSLPFLLTNSDPRFGLALNLFLWAMAIRCFTEMRRTRSLSAKLVT